MTGSNVVPIRPAPSNAGELGVESIRLGDRKIDELPIAEGAIAKGQIPLAVNAQKLSQLNNILASSPKQSVAWLESQKRECRLNIQRIQEAKKRQTQMIGDYTAQIALCEHRDREVAKIAHDDPDRGVKIRALERQFPPYDVGAMQQQITQCQESNERCDDVIAKEHASIAELEGLLQLCRKRDIDIKNLGAKVV